MASMYDTLSDELITSICRAVDEGFTEQLDTLKGLVNIPSQRGEEAEAQNYMAARYAERGYSVDQWKINIDDIKDLPGFSPVHVSYDDAFNVVATHKSRTQAGKSLILNGHIDVVPVESPEKWQYGPYSGDIVGDWMYGRGAGDMKSGLLACLAAMDALKKCGFAPAADVFLQSVVEEECTGNGALACLARGYRADAAFIPEPLQPKLMRAQVGPVWFKVTVGGDPQHASADFSGAGANAIEKAIYLIESLKELEKEWNERKKNYQEYSCHSHPIRFNLGTIQGGKWASSVPAECVFEMRVAVYPGQDLAEAREELTNFILDKARQDPFLKNNLPEVVFHGFMAEGYVLKDSDDLEEVLKQAHYEVFKEELQEHVTTAASDARFFGLYAGTPTIVYGPECTMPHGYDEAVSLTSLKQVTKTIALFIAGWCGVEEIA